MPRDRSHDDRRTVVGDREPTRTRVDERPQQRERLDRCRAGRALRGHADIRPHLVRGRRRGRCAAWPHRCRCSSHRGRGSRAPTRAPTRAELVRLEAHGVVEAASSSTPTMSKVRTPMRFDERPIRTSRVGSWLEAKKPRRARERLGVAHLALDDDAGAERLADELDELVATVVLLDHCGRELRRADLETDDAACLPPPLRRISMEGRRSAKERPAGACDADRRPPSGGRRRLSAGSSAM